MGSNILKPQKRVAYFDVLNIAATFGVIMLHCNGIAHTYSETLAWYQALLAPFAIYAIGLFGVFVLKKIPVLKNIVP